MTSTSAGSAAPQPECDLILKGGIASGVVFPSAVAELARHYRFRSVGGTSAGAIAAVVAAAAEYGRRRSMPKGSASASPAYSGFDRIDGLAAELGQAVNGRSRIVSLFQPSKAVAPLFRIALGLQSSAPSGTAGRGGWPWYVKLTSAVFTEFCVVWIVGLVIATVVAAWLLARPIWIPADLVGAAAAWIGLGIVIPLVVTIARLAWLVVKALPKIRYGMCSGTRQPDGKTDGLIEWMHGLVQEVAGRPPTRPLTFGQLWTLGESETAASTTAKRQIELVLITSNLTQGLSHRLPFIEKSGRQPLYFCKSELMELLPAEVVDWMVEHPNGDELPIPQDRGEELHRLPAPADLPVVFGARISLSFPILLQAVPLYMVARPGTAVVRCWFSDGGITSNFPIHLFDSPLPSRPTFCIDLAPRQTAGRSTPSPLEETDPKVIEAWKYVSMPSRNAEGHRARFNRFDDAGPSLKGFLSAMLDTAREGRDNELSLMPGYRDRIVSVELAADEGGLHLDMPAKIIDDLALRGRLAAKLIGSRFDGRTEIDPQSGKEMVLDWDNHRWVRFRSTMAAIEVVINELNLGWQRGGLNGGSSSYADLLAASSTKAPYGWANERTKQAAAAATDALLALAEQWSAQGQIFDNDNPDRGNAPRPKPVLRMNPVGDRDPIAMGFADRSAAVEEQQVSQS